MRLNLRRKSNLRPGRASVASGGYSMRRIAMLLALALGFMIPLYAQQDNSGAQDKSARKEMTGTLCNAANVVEKEGKATCDPTKQGGSDDMVFIDDEGKAT